MIVFEHIHNKHKSDDIQSPSTEASHVVEATHFWIRGHHKSYGKCVNTRPYDIVATSDVHGIVGNQLGVQHGSCYILNLASRKRYSVII